MLSLGWLMRINTDAYEQDLLHALTWMRGKIGGLLNRKVAEFTRLEALSELYQAYHAETFDLELGLADQLKYLGITGHLRRPVRASPPLNFAISAYRVWQNLSATGQKRFEERLNEAFKQTYGLRPLAFELTAAIHFMRAGCNVTFVDMESNQNSSPRTDFLVEKDGVAFDLECKAFSADAGRKIDRKNLCKLGGIFLPSIKECLPDNGICATKLTINIGINELSDADLYCMASSIKESLILSWPPKTGQE